MSEITDLIEEDIKAKAEPTEPIEPIEPAEPTEPVEPTEPKEPVEPTEPVEPKEPTDPIEQIVPDRLKIASELFGQEFDDEETVAETIRSLKERDTQYQQMASELEELKAGVDPLQFFVSEDEYKRQQMLKQFPDYDPMLITRVSREDISKLSDLDAIRLHRRLKDSDVYQYDSDVDLLLKKELGLDADEDINPDEFDRSSQVQLKKMGKDARRDFEKIRAEVKMPERVDLIAKKAEEQKAYEDHIATQKPLWERAVRDLPKELNKVEFKYTDPESKEEVVLYEHEIDDSFRKEVAKVLPQAVELLSKSGKDYSKQTEKEEVTKIINTLKQKYVSDNMGKIMFAFRNKSAKEAADKEHEESHNPKKPNLSEAPVKQKTSQQLSKEKAEAIIEASFELPVQ